ncbi:MAG: outer membrane lipoprotein-sorting protein [Halanaerobium sp.]|nr:outer membrane lipoprotein-sorting protein [Halanaerobium sp.]
MSKGRIRGISLLVLGLLVVISLPGLTMAMDVNEIIARVDENQHISSARMEAEMLIVKGDREIGKNMTVLTKGDSAYIKFTNPKDRGTKYLKVGANLWMFFPDAEEIIKITGSMLDQGMMGSDFSYQDIMESEKLTDLYTFSLLREEEYHGRSCYVVEGFAKEDAEVTYFRRVSWIDKERFVVLKEELYAQSGRILKVMRADKVEQFDQRWYITEAVMEDKLRKDTRTEFRITDMQFNIDIPADTFTLQNLR